MFETIVRNLATCLYRTNQNCIYDKRRVAVNIVSFLVVASFFAFLFCEADSMEEYVTSAYFCTTMLGIFLSFLHTTTETASIFALVKIHESFKRRLKYPISKTIYDRTHRLVEKFSKIMYFVIESMTAPCFVLPKTIQCYFDYFISDVGSEAFELPLPMWFPFDYKTPSRYLFATGIQLAVFFFASRYLACFLTLAFGAHMFGLSSANDMIVEVHLINKAAKENESEKSIRKRFIELVTMHSDIKQQFSYFTKVYQPTIAILFSGSIVAICTAMLLFQVNISSNDVNTVVILVSFVYAFWAFVMLLFACEIGQQQSVKFIKLHEKISQLEWIYLPIKLQQMLPTIMIVTQQTQLHEIQCFGSVTCNRQTFKMIVNRGYTFFMMLRKFYE